MTGEVRECRHLLGLVALTAGAAVCTDALAQPPASASVRADQLFREGKEALEAGRFAEACPKLAESQELDPGTGTLLALALCHEGLGATATASREFAEVAAASQAARPDRAALAQKHVTALQASLSTIQILVPSTLRGRLRVQVDKVDSPEGSWGTPVPTDPGDHTVIAEVPGGRPWKDIVHLRARDHQIVHVPELDTPAPDVAPPPPASTTPGRHTAALAVGGVGIASFAIGSVFGILALTEHGDATSLCPTSKCSSAEGVSENSTAESYAWAADFGIGIGLVAMGTAAYLLLTEKKDAPRSETSTLRVMPLVGRGTTGLAVGASW
jgi:hypothetical protein